MNTEDFYSIISILVVAITAVLLLTLVVKGRFRNTRKRDKFTSRDGVGVSRVGTMKVSKTYREVARERNLPEASKIANKLNPKITHSMTVASKDVREKEEDEE